MRIVALTVVLLCSSPANAADAVATAERSDDRPAAIAATLDAALRRAWAADGVAPTRPASDGEFLRRASLDVIGRIPTVAEARSYLDDPRPVATKRRELVRRLFAEPTHLVHQTNLWRNVLIPEASSDIASRQLIPEFEDWLRQRLLAGDRYDDLVREILTVPRLELGTEIAESRPGAFFDIREDKPERLAASTARAFLGVRLECAQCHDHPFDRWTQDQFWQFAAFFAASEEFDSEGRPIAAIAVPETDRTVTATFPDESIPTAAFDPRQPLADWIVSDRNRYFAPAVANRLWAQFFGAGLVEPVDDFSPANPATHPAVLAILADAIRDSGYDLELVSEAIVLTELYGLSSATDESDSDPVLLTRMPVRAMTPEQLYDSLSQATGRLRPFDPSQPVNFNNDEDRTRFLERFAREAVAARDQGSSILQALMLMNGAFIGDATDLAESRTLAAIATSPFLAPAEQVDALYLAAYARYPRRDESARAVAYLVESASPEEGLADLFWVLLNSGEFVFNH